MIKWMLFIATKVCNMPINPINFPIKTNNPKSTKGVELILSAFATFKPFLCRAYGNRTRDSSVKGRCLNPLTNAPFPCFLGVQK